MAPKYKLTYFNLTGRAEPIRYLLSYGELDFEDNRLSMEEWPVVKAKIGPPLGQMPLLEFDGHMLFQSTAICRYLASVVGLTGATPLENWEIDAVVDSTADFKSKISDWWWESDETKKQVLKQAIKKEHIPFFLSKFEEWTKQKNGYLAAGKLTWADLHFIANQETITKLLDIPPILVGYPNLQALETKVFSFPGIKAWLERRPTSIF